MLQNIKLKAYLVFALIHAGLAVSIYALSSVYGKPGVSPIFPYLVAGTVAMYGGVVLGALFVYLPAAPWISRIQRLLDFKSWIKEIPTIVAMLPILVPLIAGVIHLLRKYWADLKTHFKKGNLDVRTFAKATRRFAMDAEAHVNQTRSNGHHRRKRRTNGKARKTKNTVVYYKTGAKKSRPKTRTKQRAKTRRVAA